MLPNSFSKKKYIALAKRAPGKIRGRRANCPAWRGCKQAQELPCRAIRAKHLIGTSGGLLLAAATFLNVRFHRHDVWKGMLSREAAQQEVAALAFQASQDHSDLVKRMRTQSENPMSWSLADLAADGKGRGRGRGRKGRGRGRGSTAQEAAAPKARSGAILQADAAVAGQNVKRRRLKEQASAEEWFFGATAKTAETEEINGTHRCGSGAFADFRTCALPF